MRRGGFDCLSGNESQEASNGIIGSSDVEVLADNEVSDSELTQLKSHEGSSQEGYQEETRQNSDSELHRDLLGDGSSRFCDGKHEHEDTDGDFEEDLVKVSHKDSRRLVLLPSEGSNEMQITPLGGGGNRKIVSKSSVSSIDSPKIPG